jgi:DnaK suppressor protein
MLSKKKLKNFENILNERLDALLNEANKTVTGMIDPNENMPDPADRATLESDRNFTLRIRDRERKLINKIKEALARIQDKTYGICDSCEENISEQRLMARPVTTLCIECKQNQENDEKMKGL